MVYALEPLTGMEGSTLTFRLTQLNQIETRMPLGTGSPDHLNCKVTSNFIGKKATRVAESLVFKIMKNSIEKFAS